MSSESILSATLIILAIWNKIILDALSKNKWIQRKLKVFCECLSKNHNFWLNFWYWIKILFCRHVIYGVKVWPNCQNKKSHFSFFRYFLLIFNSPEMLFLFTKFVNLAIRELVKWFYYWTTNTNSMQSHQNLGGRRLAHKWCWTPNCLILMISCLPLSHQDMVDWLGSKKNAYQVFYSKITFSHGNIYFAYKVVKCDYKRKSHASFGIISAYFSFACTCYHKIEESSPLC